MSGPFGLTRVDGRLTVGRAVSSTTGTPSDLGEREKVDEVDGTSRNYRERAHACTPVCAHPRPQLDSTVNLSTSSTSLPVSTISSQPTGHPAEGPGRHSQGDADPLVHVRTAGSHRLARQSEFDPVPCRMRLSMPGRSRFENGIPGVGKTVSRNDTVLVWCECMAQTADQLRVARGVALHGLDPDSVKWPVPKQQRGWDVLGGVRTIEPGSGPIAASSRARRANPTATQEAAAMWRQHVAERRAAIEARRERLGE